jgi:serine/threonine protein phosphatase Stp1
MTNPRCRYSAATHVGRVRKLNEDAVIALPEHGVWVVSDGMGGHEAGEFASQTVIEAMAMLPPGLDGRGKMIALREAIARAHSLIRQEADRRGVSTIGATVVALTLADEYFLALWAGDSRAYLLRDGELTQLTTDHSLVADLVESGEISWDEADVHPQSNAITRAVGVGDEIEIDKVHGECLSGDRFLLCSDGLTKYARQATLRKMLATLPIETVCDRLMHFALDSGGGDNISVIVVDVI